MYANNDSIHFSFFTSHHFSCLFSLAKISMTVVKRNGQGGLFVCFLMVPDRVRGGGGEDRSVFLSSTVMCAEGVLFVFGFEATVRQIRAVLFYSC